MYVLILKAKLPQNSQLNNSLNLYDKVQLGDGNSFFMAITFADFCQENIFSHVPVLLLPVPYNRQTLV